MKKNHFKKLCNSKIKSTCEITPYKNFFLYKNVFEIIQSQRYSNSLKLQNLKKEFKRQKYKFDVLRKKSQTTILALDCPGWSKAQFHG